MFHGIDYPDENYSKDEDGNPLQNFDIRFFDCLMKDGIIIFQIPDTALKRRTVYKNLPIKEFILGQNVLPVDNERW